MVVQPFVGFVLDPTAAGPAFRDVHGLPINSYGFIDSGEPIRSRSPQRRIVAITGGSVAYFFSVHGVAELERGLRRRPGWGDVELTFVRLALGGLKQPQQLAAIQYLQALGAEFDLVINIDGFNEVALFPSETDGSSLSYAFPRGWPALVGETPDPVFTQLVGKLALYRSLSTRWDRLFEGWLPARSSAASLLWLAGHRQIHRRIGWAEVVASRRAGATDRFAATGPPNSFESEQEMRQALVDLWARSSALLGRACAASGIEYLHVLQPNQYAEHSKPLSPEELASSYAPNSPIAVAAAAGYRLLPAAGRDLAASGTPFLDLTRIFDGDPETVYIDSCCHLNERGYERMATAIGERWSGSPP